jgi:electron transfer flavoprotein alpha subunit
MAILVLADRRRRHCQPADAQRRGRRHQIGGDVHVLVLGKAAAAQAAAKLPGVAKVILADGPAYEHGLAEPAAALMVALAPGYSHLLAPGSAMGKNVMPRVAALLDVQIDQRHRWRRECRHLPPLHLCRQRAGHGEDQRREEGADRPRRVLRSGAAEGGSAAVEPAPGADPPPCPASSAPRSPRASGRS